MRYRTSVVAALALATTCFLNSPTLAAKLGLRYGTFVRADGKQILMQDSKGKDHVHNLSADTKITLDGKASKVVDLMSGMKLRVTNNDETKLAVSVEAIDKLQAFENTRDGEFVSLIDDKLVMTQRGRKYAHTLAADAPLTLDGQPCIASDFKVGLKIRVTTKPDDKNLATSICAIQKDSDF